jgi:hypothetical protein
MTTTPATLPAYMVDEGHSIQLPGSRRWKRIYRVEDAGVRYDHRDGAVWHIPQIRFHYNAPERSGLPGTLTVDYDEELITH